MLINDKLNLNFTYCGLDMDASNNDASQKTNSDSVMKIKDKTTSLHTEPDSGTT